MSFSRMAALIVAGLFAAGAASVSAQTLGEVAKKEQQRRKNAKTSEKVYTNKDLGPGGTASPPPAASAGGDTKGAGGATATTKPDQPAQEDPTKTESYWRDRMDAVKSELERSEVLLEALQSRVNALATDFVNRDDPAQRAVIANNRQRALEELAVTRDKIEKLKQQIADIEEEARKAGVPPGWLR